MADIVNLRLARKRRDRATKDEAAAENRARHGRTKAEKQLDRATADKERSFVDGHRRDGDRKR